MADTVNPALKNLEILVGEWEVDIDFPRDPPGHVHEHFSITWVEEGAFLRMQGQAAGGPPSSVAIVGRAETEGHYTVLYYDERGVSRTHLMSLQDGEWKQWRNASDFAQRFVGNISADGNTITARWEKADDGITWQHDFNLTYTRVR